MTIYILDWTDSDASYCSMFEAFTNYRLASKKYNEIAKDAKTNADITLLEKEDAIKKVIINNKRELISAINSINLN